MAKRSYPRGRYAIYTRTRPGNFTRWVSGYSSLVDAKSRLDYFCAVYSSCAYWLRDEKNGRVLHAANTKDGLVLPPAPTPQHTPGPWGLGIPVEQTPQPFPQTVERAEVAALPQPCAPGCRKLNLGNE